MAATTETKPDRYNPLPCGCGIKGTPYLDPVGDRGYEYKDLFIDFCPLHAAAGELLEALRHIRLIVSPALIGRDECEKLDEAIRKAGGE
jgi:hypothetical protein